ncbi:hypothetical protein PG993_002139 [Apiospora rasikravindrae]|uniref:Uncharacterized protein n=1 Tax=Apiospora rasikravindrae TaxID=990691 RepID=A0ABR1UDD3_9PEZI
MLCQRNAISTRGGHIGTWTNSAGGPKPGLIGLILPESSSTHVDDDVPPGYYQDAAEDPGEKSMVHLVRAWACGKDPNDIV